MKNLELFDDFTLRLGGEEEFGYSDKIYLKTVKSYVFPA